MLDIKTNYKNKYKNDLIGADCAKKKKKPMQEHIFEECEETEKADLRIDTNLLFSISTTILKTQAKKLEKLMDLLNTSS